MAICHLKQIYIFSDYHVCTDLKGAPLHTLGPCITGTAPDILPTITWFPLFPSFTLLQSYCPLVVS